MDERQVYFFDDERLRNFDFWLSESDFGYGEDGNMFWGEELEQRRKKGGNHHEYLHKLVFMSSGSDRGTYFGSIEATPDNSVWAHGPYYPPSLWYLDVFGFENEYYAIRYLCQVLNISLTREKPISLPSFIGSCCNFCVQTQLSPILNSENNNDIYRFGERHSEEHQVNSILSNDSYLAIFREVLLEDLAIGLIAQSLDGTWQACSNYFPGTDRIVVSGFASSFYASRYLHELVLVMYPECIESDPPPLPWQK
ncbi:MAG: hypothetical protein F6K30_17930 [Cyanothece sp. SIO2G6]|nr:hypothetical protein [Cyanothece sp. SIO2G6]